MTRKLQTVVKALDEAVGERIGELEPEEQQEVLSAVIESLNIKLAHFEEHLD